MESPKGGGAAWEEAPVLNASCHQPSVLLLTGIPGLDVSHHPWISIPFCFFYFLALSGNGAILFIVRRTPSLREPMYYFLSMLAVVDLGLVTCTLPTTLAVFWFDIQTISFDACLAQMYFLHLVSILESSVLLAMAVDRLVAISWPLRYRAFLTNGTILRSGLAMLLRAGILLLPIPFLLKRLPYGHNHRLSHSFCFHPDIMKLACADTQVNMLYGLVVVLSTVGVDSLLIVLSYLLILRTVVKVGAGGKAWNTCVSHFCAVLVFFIPMIGLSVIHRFGNNLHPMVSTVVAYIYLIVPPALNPVIYSIKSTQIRKALLKALLWKKEPEKGGWGQRRGCPCLP